MESDQESASRSGVVALLDGPPGDARLAAIDSLGQMGPKHTASAAANLIRLLDDPDMETRVGPAGEYQGSEDRTREDDAGRRPFSRCAIALNLRDLYKTQRPAIDDSTREPVSTGVRSRKVDNSAGSPAGRGACRKRQPGKLAQREIAHGTFAVSVRSFGIAALTFALSALGVAGCAATPYKFGTFHPQAPGGSALQPVEVVYGKPHKTLDRLGWIVGIPSKILTLNKKTDNHRISPETVEAV